MRTDPLQNLMGLRIGARVSLRSEVAGELVDRIGLVVDLDGTGLTLEDRTGREHRLTRSQIRLARLIPTVARGRNPRHAPPDLLRTMVSDPALGGPPGAAVEASECWIARLCDLVDHLDDTQVTPLPDQHDTRTAAAYATSRGMVHGEWAALRLLEAAALEPLAAWAARRDARNLVLTSPLPAGVLTGFGLQRLAEELDR